MTSKQEAQFSLPNLDATTALGNVIAQGLVAGVCIYLNGQLGAGKTTLVRAILQHLGVTGRIKSPTYTIVEEYALANFTIYHFDLYRVADPQELDNLGIREYLRENSVCIFEWADKGFGKIPPADLMVDLHYDTTQRYAKLVANSNLGQKILEKI
jgi:tRNA threonylcarbamoyladenosine biosynthesis protein TsaE